MATNNAANIATALAGTILQGAGVGVAPLFSTATYPSTVAVSSILYASATNVLSELTTTANRIFVTGTGGIPVWGTSVASDFSFTTSGSGVTRIVSIVHGSNTANSNATFQATVAGSSGGDAASKYTVSGVADWSIGLDNSDSDAFVISSGTTLGTNNVFRSASNGDLTITNIAAGTWNGTAITETKGGTNQTSYTTGDTLYASGANTLAKRAIGNSGDVLTVAGGVPTWAAPSSLPWTDVSGTSQSLAVNNGYMANNAGLVTLTLPAIAAQFTIIRVAGNGAGGWTIAQNANQNIKSGNQTTTTGVTGTLSSSNRYDCVELMCTVANTTWVALSGWGNLTYA